LGLKVTQITTTAVAGIDEDPGPGIDYQKHFFVAKQLMAYFAFFIFITTNEEGSSAKANLAMLQ
jgi:hypothetical protein